MDGAKPKVAIEVHDLVVGFGGQVVLDHLSLNVRAGEILGVVGGSGAGKSVLLRTIIGLIPKQSGTISVFDATAGAYGDPAWRAVEKRWGILFQQGALFSSLTVRENIEFPMRQHLDLSAATMAELAMVKLDLVGLSPNDANKYPSELSGGMTKRVGIARALALDPEILFLDEPTSGLDPIAAGDFDQLIHTLKQTLGLTVFMVTHDLDSLRHACDRVAALAGGRIVEEGTLAEVLTSAHPWVKDYFAGRKPLNERKTMNGAG
jgi:phospholipid/cholesterol/gamma-HCH transport system ATP-binding protein